MNNLIKSEFLSTPAPLYSGNIQNFNDLKNHAIEKGFQYTETLKNGYRLINLKNKVRSTDLILLENYPENHMTMSIILASIRERLSRQK